MKPTNDMRMARSALLTCLLLISWAAVPMGAQAAQRDCERECLGDFVSRYVDAMIAHTPAVLPIADDLKFTEDSVPLKLGEGLWETASSLRRYRQDVLDVRHGVAASRVIVMEGNAPVLPVLRLRILSEKIAEVETLVVRSQKEGVRFKPDALTGTSRVMEASPDRSQIVSRQEAVRLAEFYPEGLKVGSFVTVDVPFSEGAYRMENGILTAGPGCTLRAGCGNIKTQTIIKHPGITHRVAAVDEDLGIVLIRMNFGETNSYGPGNALIAWEAFKICGGQIHAVEAFMKIMPSSVDTHDIWAMPSGR